jgi:protein O-GlcNAc transferase
MPTSHRQSARCAARTGSGVAILWLSLALAPLIAQQPAANSAEARLTAADSAMRAGIAAVTNNDLGLARRDFAQAVRLAPQVEATHAALGSVLLAQGDLKAALDELQQAHQLDAADAAATLNLAQVRSGLGDSDAAIALFREALAVPNPPTLSPEEALAFANSLSAADQVAEAETELTEALLHAPDSAPLHDALGVLLAQSGHTDQALPHFQRAVALDPTLSQAQYLLGTSLLFLEEPEAAVSPLQQAAAAMPDSFDAHLQLGRALSAMHRDPAALVELHRAAALRTTNTPADASYALALALEASGDAATSLPLFLAATTATTALGAPTLGNAALINYALALVQTGNARDALPLYARALALGPDSATLREDYGVAYLQQADLDHAIAQFQAGVALAPESAQIHYDLGLAYKLKDDLTRAIPELVRAGELDPSLPDPAYTLGVIYMQQGRFPDAATQLRLVTALQPANGAAWAALGGVLKEEDDTPGAIDALRRAAALEPEQPSLHIQLAALLVRTGKPAEAAAERKLAADLSRAAVSQQRATFALKSGRTLLAEGKLPEAIVQLTAAVEAAPQLAECHTLLAEALSRQGKPAEAALERRRAAALQPDSAPPAP